MKKILITGAGSYIGTSFEKFCGFVRLPAENEEIDVGVRTYQVNYYRSTLEDSIKKTEGVLNEWRSIVS